MTFNTFFFFFIVSSKGPGLRKHEIENMALEELTVGGHMLYTHFFYYIYIHSWKPLERSAVYRQSCRKQRSVYGCMLLAGRQPAKAVN